MDPNGPKKLMGKDEYFSNAFLDGSANAVMLSSACCVHSHPCGQKKYLAVSAMHGFCMAVLAVININVTMTTSKVCIIVKHCLRSVQVRNWSQMQHVSRLELCRQTQKVLLGSSSSDCRVCY